MGDTQWQRQHRARIKSAKTKEMPADSEIPLSGLGSGEMISAKDITRDDIDELQRQMGQTGLEAGDPDASPRNKLYVNSKKSLNINTYLTTDGETIHSPYSDWDSLGYTKADVERAIEKIDSGMRPLVDSFKLYRYVDGDSLGMMLDDSRINNRTINGLIRDLESGRRDIRDLSAALQNTDYTHKAYTSTTYLASHGTYESRRVMLNIVATKGTPGIITANHREHEILLGRGLKYTFTGGVHIVNGQLVIDVYI